MKDNSLGGTWALCTTSLWVDFHHKM